MDLSTKYLGLTLSHPLMAGASPLVDDLDMVRRLEDAGAAAIVMHSLFEEQITREQVSAQRILDTPAESFAEALSYFPEPEDYMLGPDEYLEQIRRVKSAVGVPVMGSLNGVTDRGWLEYARLIEQAGADALELNVYSLETDATVPAEQVEQRIVDMVQSVRRATRLPLAIKLSPFYTSLGHFTRRLVEAGADGIVLFNRFYQPDIDIEELEVAHRLRLSDSSELLLRLRWLAVLYGAERHSLAVTGGVHTGVDALKAVMAGASGVQMVSALLHHGPEHIATVREEMNSWLDEHEYNSLGQALGSMSLEHCPEPAAYERGNYVRILQNWRDNLES
jgi:dihydroorotate dehydrogenase (fumarate)